MTDSHRRPSLLPVLALLASLSLASPGLAADSENRSRQLFKQADALAAEGKWTEACALFQAAHDINATGGTALRTADCYEKIGKYDRALELYQFILDHRATDKEPERVKIAENRSAAIKKLLEPAPPPPPTSTAAPPPPPTSTAAPPPPPPNRTPAWISFGAGGAFLVVGGVLGGLALADASALKDKCKNGICTDPNWKDDRAVAYAKGWASTVSLGVGAAGVVVGVVLLATTTGKTHDKIKQAVRPNGLTFHF